MFMRPVFAAARGHKRIAYAEGEDERVLRAVQAALDETRQAHPHRPPGGDRARIKSDAGLRLVPGRDVEVVNPRTTPLPPVLGGLPPPQCAQRRDTGEMAKAAVRRSTTTIAALMIHLGDADGMLCGTGGPLRRPLRACAR